MRPSHNTDFSVFLSNRSYDETGFLKWVYGQSPEKPFFPFVSDVYEGQVSDFVRDPTTNEVVGVFLTNLLMKHRVGKEGNLVPISIGKEVKKTPEEVPIKEAEPAPPGIEDNEDVKAADLNYAEKERLPPDNVQDWSALHHLQYCVMNESKFFITDENKVKFEEKNVEFDFDLITNFQAETGDNNANKDLWSSSGPFYSIGTLAYFVKCLGLKFSAYVRRVETLQHKQFVKKRDHSAVIQYLSASGDKIAPFNVRKLSDVPKDNDNSLFFKDHQAIKDDTYCLPMIKNVPIDLAIGNVQL